MGTSSERMNGRDHVNALPTCCMHGGWASYFYTPAVPYDHILLIHYSSAVGSDVMGHLSKKPIQMFEKSYGISVQHLLLSNDDQLHYGLQLLEHDI